MGLILLGNRMPFYPAEAPVPFPQVLLGNYYIFVYSDRLFIPKTARNFPVHPFQNIPYFFGFRSETPLLGFRGVFFTCFGKPVKMHGAAPVLSFAVPLREVAGEDSRDLPAAFDTPVLCNVMPGFAKCCKVFCPGMCGNRVRHPPPANDVSILMAELVTWLNTPTDIHPVLITGITQFQLVHIHPFLDGNGRTSRLLSTLCLYRSGYDFKRLFTISEYYDRDRASFYSAIQGVREQDLDMTGWLEYFIVGLSTQLTEVKKRGELAIRKDVLVGKYDLSKRQSMALAYLFEQGKITIQEYEALCPKISRRTLQRDFKYMLEKNVIREKGVGGATDPTRHYVLVEL